MDISMNVIFLIKNHLKELKENTLQSSSLIDTAIIVMQIKNIETLKVLKEIYTKSSSLKTLGLTK
jgi:hypothetical protein